MVRSIYLIFIIILWLYSFCCATSNLIINHRSATLEHLYFLLSFWWVWAKLVVYVVLVCLFFSYGTYFVDDDLIELIYLTSLSAKLWQGAQLCGVKAVSLHIPLDTKSAFFSAFLTASSIVVYRYIHIKHQWMIE